SAFVVTQVVFHSLDELYQYRFGIPEDRIVRRIVLVDVPFVIGRMNDCLPCGDRRGNYVVARQTGADGQYHVRFLEKCMNWSRHKAGGGAKGEGMMFGKGAFTLEGCRHGRLQKFG